MKRCGEKSFGPNSGIQDAANLAGKDERSATAGCKSNVESLENKALHAAVAEIATVLCQHKKTAAKFSSDLWQRLAK